MNKGMVVAAAVGFILIAALLSTNDFSAIYQAVYTVGWGLIAIVCVRATILVLCGQAWGLLIHPHVRRWLSLYNLLRWIREAINVLLPVAQVGGDLVGGRLLTFWSVPSGIAGASILVDLLIQAVAQLIFTLAGLGVLIGHGGGDMIVRTVIIGLLIAAPALAGFFLSQRFGLFRLVEKGLEAIAAKWPRTAMGSDLRLHDSLQVIYSKPMALAGSFALHLVAWFVGAAEVWIALYCMGLSPTLVEALVLESLGQAVRGSAFPVPGAVGFQEGGFVVLGQLFGLSPEISIALSLIKRVPDIVLGLPGLFVWHGLESRRLLGGGGSENFYSFGAPLSVKPDTN